MARFANDFAEDLAQRWKALPVGTLVANGPELMVYLGFVDEGDGLPAFWFWTMNPLTQWGDKYAKHLRRDGVGTCAYFRPVDVDW